MDMPLTREAYQGFVNEITTKAEKLNAEASVALMISTAIRERDRVIGEAVGRTGVVPSYIQVVDGVEGAPLEAVRPDGSISFVWRYNSEIASLVRQMLVARSPIDSGEYVFGIVTMVDNEPVDFTKVPADAATIQIVATVPYSRRLEVGKRHDGRPFVVQVKPHIVEETAILARQLYGDVASITFGYVDLWDAYELRLAESRRPRRWRNGRWYRQHAERRTAMGYIETKVRYPAIMIVPK